MGNTSNPESIMFVVVTITEGEETVLSFEDLR